MTTDLQQPARSPCGIEENSTSVQIVEIQNIGGSHEDVYVEARSIHEKTEFVKNNIGSPFSICFVLPIQSGDIDTIDLRIKQYSMNPGRSTDKLHIDVAYEPAQRPRKQQIKSTPNSANPVSQLTSTVTLDRNP